MIDVEQIKQWVHEGIITQEQARKMIADVTASKQEHTSNQIIIAVSIIGSILLGIGCSSSNLI